MGISRLGVVGGGTMGTGIAQSAVIHGVDTILVDVDQSASDRGLTIVAGHIDGAAARGRLPAAEAAAAIDRLTATGDPGALADCDLVIEAVFEDFDLKRGLLGSLNAVLRPDALLATNTSSFRVDDLAPALDDPGRFLGMHYFVPAGVNKLVEVVHGAATASATVEAAADFVRATGKQPLVCGDSNGFVVNRFFIPYFNEAVRIYEDGVAPAQIDEVARATFQAAAGPFFVMNLSKTRICLDSCRTLVRFGSFYAPADALVAQGEAGAPFDIEDDARPLTGAARADVADRLRAATFLPVLELLAEGVTTADGIDLGANLALRWDHPPCRMMDTLGRTEVERMTGALADRFGASVPATVAGVGRLVA
jgi:3-hydroxybutyryl-CoA dehydrogenase